MQLKHSCFKHSDCHMCWILKVPWLENNEHIICILCFVYVDVLISYMCHKTCMLVFVIVCVFCEWKLISIKFAFWLFSRVYWWFLCCLLWCLIVTCLLVFVNIWILFVCDWKLMSITFAYYRLARSTNGAKLTLCCFSHFWTAAQKYAFNLWPENKTKNSHNELKIA